MAKAYKFMFDKRFDSFEEEDFSKTAENVSEPDDGLPSISELLDTIQNDISETDESVDMPMPEEIPENPISADDLIHLQENEKLITDLQQQIEQMQEQINNQKQNYTFEELETAKQTAFSEGKSLGMQEAQEATWQEAMTSIDKQNSDLLQTIDSSLKTLLEASNEMTQKAFETALQFSTAVCEKVIPAIAEKNAVAEIKDLLEKNFHFLKEEPKIYLRINPFLADKIRPIIAEIIKKESFEGKVSLVRDENIAIGDCRVEWKNGGLERNIDEILTQTKDLVTTYLKTTQQTPNKENGEE